MSVEDDDQAWVTVEAPLDPGELLREFARRPDRLYRLHPMIEWNECRIDGAFLCLKSEAREERARIEELPDGVRLDWMGDNLKAWTRISVEGGLLRIEEDYSRLPVEARRLRLAELDGGLPTWGLGIRGFLIAWENYGKLPFWRNLALSLWLRMNPRTRRIARLLCWLTLAEFMLFIIVMIVFVVEVS